MNTFDIKRKIINDEPKQLPWKLYGLRAEGNQKWRYIGYTGKRPEVRLSSHLYERDKFVTHKTNWLNNVIKTGGTIEMVVLNSFKTEAEVKDAEITAISKYRRLGHNLTNITDGGEGLNGYIPSKEQRKAQSKRHKQWNKKHPEFRKRRSKEVAKWFSQPGVREAQSKRIKKYFKNNPHHGNRAIIQMTLDGDHVQEWISAAEAGRHGYSASAITACVIGNSRTANGFRWEYSDGSSPEWIAPFSKPRGPNIHAMKGVIQKDMAGNFIAEHRSIAEAAQSEKNLNYRTISEVCLGNRCSHGGYRWEYADGSSPEWNEPDSSFLPPKAVVQLTIEGLFIKNWESSCEVERQTGWNRSGVTQCCLGTPQDL